jgi:hypothetical protein
MRRGAWLLVFALLGGCDKKGTPPPPPPGTAGTGTTAGGGAGGGPAGGAPGTAERDDAAGAAATSLADLLQPLPNEIVAAGLGVPVDVAALEERWGAPEAEDGRLLLWNNVSIGGCGLAAAATERAGAGAGRHVEVGLNECGEVALEWLDALGTPASSPDAAQEEWWFAEGRVTREREGTRPFRFLIEGWREADLRGFQESPPRPAVLEGVERMKRALPAWSLDGADPLALVEPFRGAVLSGDPRFMRPLAFPFSANGLLVTDLNHGADILGKLNRETRGRLAEEFRRATSCSGATFAGLVRGEPLPYLDRRPEVQRTPESLEREFRRLAPEPADFIVNCTESEGTWGGVFFLFRKVDGRWRPAGLLD